MLVCDALVRSVRLELNHIYTEKPFQTATGLDMGWFCREHALHVAALAEMVGESARICRGDVILRIPDDLIVSTVGSGSDHAWCEIDHMAPVDASLTLRYVAPHERDVQVICPSCLAKYLSGFKLCYEMGMADNAFSQYSQSDERLIAYNEKSIIEGDILELLATPYNFLHPPPPGAPSLTQFYGPDVFFAITAHLYKLAQGEARPMRTYLSPKNAIRRMVRNNPDAPRFVEDKIHGSAT